MRRASEPPSWSTWTSPHGCEIWPAVWRRAASMRRRPSAVWNQRSNRSGTREIASSWSRTTSWASCRRPPRPCPPASSDRATVSLIFRYLRAYRKDFLLGLLCLGATNALTLAIPWLLKKAIEALRQAAAMRQIGTYALAICGVAAALAVVRTWSRLLVLGASRRIVYDIRSDLFAHLQTLPASFYARNRTGEIMSRTVNDLILI